jgi:hypothetical protein
MGLLRGLNDAPRRAQEKKKVKQNLKNPKGNYLDLEKLTKVP